MLSSLKTYWERLRAGRIAPYRAEIDPRQFESALENMFIVEKLAPDNMRIRLAGMKICEMMGMEVRGMQPALPDRRGRPRPLRPPAQRGDDRAGGGRAQARRPEPRRDLPRHHAADAAPQRLRRHQPGDRLHLRRGRALRAAARLRDRGRGGHPGRAQPGRRAEAADARLRRGAGRLRRSQARPAPKLRSIDGNPNAPAKAATPRRRRGSGSSTASRPAPRPSKRSQPRHSSCGCPAAPGAP